MMKRTLTTKLNLVERNEFVVSEHPHDDANQLGEHRSRVKKHVSIAVGVEVNIISY